MNEEELSPHDVDSDNTKLSTLQFDTLLQTSCPPWSRLVKLLVREPADIYMHVLENNTLIVNLYYQA